MKTFIRATEVWVPGPGGSTLELARGLYGEATRFAAASQASSFGYGEGLPGMAWKEGKPIILKAFEGSYFQRTAAAHADGLTCGIALPIFAGDFLTAVLVIFCGDDEEHAGAIELWHNEAGSFDMRLADGYYGSTGDAFETVSRHVSLRRGNGLPGLVWERGGPVFMADLGKAAGFLRADSAQRVGINRGFGFPCHGPSSGTWLMTWLSAMGTPLVQRFEVWEPDASGQTLRRNGGFCEQAGVLGDLPTEQRLARGQGSVGTVFLTGVPVLSDQLADEPWLGAAAVEAGLQSLVAVPIIRDGHLKSVVAWYF